MKSYLPVRDLLDRLRRTWKPWLALAAAAGVLILILTMLTLPSHNSVQASVNFSYEGIESGLNPMGGRFDPDEMKGPEIITAAAAALGMELDAGQVERIQNAIIITGNVPNGTAARITEYVSSYDDKTLNNTDAVRADTYYPTMYTLSLHYTETDLSASQAVEFLNALLSSYQAYFSTYYGYNAAFEKALREFDYSSYDYEDAVNVLESNLDGLGSYLQWLSVQNSVRYVSKTTGLSFDDLFDAINMLKTQNLSQIRSYINVNHLTKDVDALLFYYHYMIDSYERNLVQQQSVLSLLNERIASYVKDTAMVLNNGSNNDSDAQVITQPSEMYNQLIAEKIQCESTITGCRESISYYQAQIDEILGVENPGGTGDADETDAGEIDAGEEAAEEAVSEETAAGEGEQEMARKLATLQEQFRLLDTQINRILDNMKETTTEYFDTTRLTNAFIVLNAPVQENVLVRIIRRSLRPGVGVEAVVCGVYLLSSTVYVLWKKRKDADAMEQLEKEPAAAKSTT